MMFPRPYRIKLLELRGLGSLKDSLKVVVMDSGFHGCLAPPDIEATPSLRGPLNATWQMYDTEYGGKWFSSYQSLWSSGYQKPS